MAKGRIVFTKTGMPRLKQYLDEMKGVPLQDVWDDIPPVNSQAIEALGYPTQKPLVLLERIIKASSNENDIVLDAFCGCGTAILAAQNLKRQWIGIDISPTACTVMAKAAARQYNFAARTKTSGKSGAASSCKTCRSRRRCCGRCRRRILRTGRCSS
jgi:hypothetical protein